jgi:hypothetical protein
VDAVSQAVKQEDDGSATGVDVADAQTGEAQVAGPQGNAVAHRDRCAGRTLGLAEGVDGRICRGGAVRSQVRFSVVAAGALVGVVSACLSERAT